MWSAACVGIMTQDFPAFETIGVDYGSTFPQQFSGNLFFREHPFRIEMEIKAPVSRNLFAIIIKK